MANHISKKKYVDIKELKKEKLGLDWRIALKQKENKKQKPLNMKCTKGTFLEAIEKKQRRTPSPVTYSPHKYEP